MAAFALALWLGVVREPAFEVRGTVVARPAPGLLLVRHEPLPALGMNAMELMGIAADPALVDAAGVQAGDRVRLAVRRLRTQEIVALRLEKFRAP